MTEISRSLRAALQPIGDDGDADAPTIPNDPGRGRSDSPVVERSDTTGGGEGDNDANTG
jgi:hypothetical protein